MYFINRYNTWWPSTEETGRTYNIYTQTIYAELNLQIETKNKIKIQLTENDCHIDNVVVGTIVTYIIKHSERVHESYIYIYDNRIITRQYT